MKIIADIFQKTALPKEKKKTIILSKIVFPDK